MGGWGEGPGGKGVGGLVGGWVGGWVGWWAWTPRAMKLLKQTKMRP